MTDTKVCNKCSTRKQFFDFYPDVRNKNKIQGICKQCNKENRLINRDKILLYAKQHYILNKERRNEYSAKYREKNREAIAFHNRTIAKNNRGLANNRLKKYRTKKLLALPTWLTKEQLKEIEQIYVEASECNWLSEGGLHVDHIVPLQGKNVCGLHVPWNLRIIPAKENLKKGNRYE